MLVWNIGKIHDCSQSQSTIMFNINQITKVQNIDNKIRVNADKLHQFPDAIDKLNRVEWTGVVFGSERWINTEHLDQLMTAHNNTSASHRGWTMTSTKIINPTLCIKVFYK